MYVCVCDIRKLVQSGGGGLLSQFPPFRYNPNFSASPKYMLAIEYHGHIWQVSPQLSCGDICQIWMWYKEYNRYFGRIENLAYGEINERSFSNPHPWWCIMPLVSSLLTLGCLSFRTASLDRFENLDIYPLSQVQTKLDRQNVNECNLFHAWRIYITWSAL